MTLHFIYDGQLGAPSPVLEEPIADARVALGMGYAEGKWVAEAILLRAYAKIGLRMAIARVGQLAGDTRLGGWNKQEWVGAIVRLSEVVGAIPDCDESITWVPVDIAATALIDIARSDTGESVYHLVAPIPSNWRTVFGTFAQHIGVPLIPYNEWSARVTSAAESNTREADAQPLALASFFQSGQPANKSRISNVRACRVSHALASMPMLGPHDALLYLRFWEGKSRLLS